jgi:transposase
VTSAEERFAKLEARLERAEAMIAERDAEILRLRARVAELEAKLGQNSSNSHKPPSSDPPGTRPPKPPRGGKRGGQPGHKPQPRVMLPPEKVTEHTTCVPHECEHCGSRNVEPNGTVHTHQVLDIPVPKPECHQIDRHAVECQDCGEVTVPPLPPGVPTHIFGARLLALIAFLAGAKISRRRIQEILREVHGVPASLGAISEAEARASAAIEGATDEALDHVRAEAVKHVDATSWRFCGALCTLWTIATKLVTVFAITADGTKERIEQLLGTLHGFLVTDRGTTFGFWAMELRQVCWAHLVRKFVSYNERNDEGAKLGQHLLLFAQYMLARWHRVRDGTLSRKRFKAEMAPVRVAIVNLLRQGEALGLRGMSGSCRDILLHEAALFTFIDLPGIDPTNNAAERALRDFVLWRKVSNGSQSERGVLFAQRIMTVFQTLRQQRRSVFAFLVEACHATQHRLNTPSLLPATA